MAHLACPYCAHPQQFETRVCASCGHALAFEPERSAFRYLETAEGVWRAAGAPVIHDGAALCDNGRYGVCNWLVSDGDPRGLCRSCRHNGIIPDLSVAGVLDRWRITEDAKRRALWGVLRLGLSLDGPPRLTFNLLYDPFAEAGGPPMHPTGYANGLITLNLVEADDSARERIRLQMGELYRTLVGHFRHELGHHVWHALAAGSPRLEDLRRLFGDERDDYGGAAQRYYAAPPGPEWKLTHVSRYAAMHPWEDFAETFSHYLHIVDTLSVIGAFDIAVGDGRDGARVDFDPYAATTADLTRLWARYAFPLNAVNRSMGRPDLYPFEITPVIALKLDAINRLIAEAAGRSSAGDSERAGLEAAIAALSPPQVAGAQ